MVSRTPIQCIICAMIIIIGVIECPLGMADNIYGVTEYQKINNSPTDSYSDPNQSSHFLVETCTHSDLYGESIISMDQSQLNISSILFGKK
ncbi:hypothetical protein [Methanospirillum lacunae]|uniref:Uncharacterized protein n=1 Tax=Methanospirillum lacunae TaxID=668570 RepID=A0A2V2MV23_9EURY|nr:hypothetical protein DK846_10190 [Methanospirillum lacunae]